MHYAYFTDQQSPRIMTPLKRNTITKSSTMPQMGYTTSLVGKKVLMQTYDTKHEWSLSEKNVTFNDSSIVSHLHEQSNSFSSIKNKKNQQFLYVG